MPKTKIVTIQLPMEHAVTLAHLLSSVGGVPDTTWRKQTDEILETMQVAGVGADGDFRFDGSVEAIEIPNPGSGTVYVRVESVK